ncbi:Inositolphosphorylceramide synthase subunit Kei1-domain-containing protein [Phakopsora pachyrhizi]|uniref:Inositolphosphorylceramide synthase subunit Kei1-domain-containing protein n=1 Tax=Phakopsora pachyrhizi TaxID=170000 RepID=A0AAV0BQL0_PHAPC|nr:Inositolphosphorylceramide synthase subunit Kei1-domain-containing protein [Phakopsora pachyrhizi]
MQWNRSIPLLSSFLGFFDIKLGVTIISLLSLLNKVAGIYGILAVFTGGSLSQVSMYIYSILTIGLVIYGLQATGEENPRKAMIYAHYLLIDQLISTLYTIIFGIGWYIQNPHDGRRIANSDAQKNMMNPNAPDLTPELRKQAAQTIWKTERNFATSILIFIWTTKLYFILVVYSFAIHLRRNSYTTLPLSKPPSTIQTSIPNNSSSIHRSSSVQSSPKNTKAINPNAHLDQVVINLKTISKGGSNHSSSPSNSSSITNTNN